MNLSWYKTDSEVRPQEVDMDSSSTLVYFRRNIREEQREEHGEVLTFYVYDEATIPKSEYASHQTYTNQANIDFIAMMTDVELEG